MRKSGLALALLFAAPVLAKGPPPANVAAAVAGGGRPKAATDLDEVRRPVEVLRFLGLRRGDRAADLLAGGGYYSEIMGRAVGPGGSVIAWNNRAGDEKAAAAWHALSQRVPNAHLMVVPADRLRLAPSSFDFVLLHMVYHDTYWESTKYNFARMDPDAFLREVYVGTKPGGIVGVVDHVANPGGDTRAVVDALHRIDPAVLRADFERAGFVFDGESNLLRNPADDHSKLVFDPSIRGKTDRVLYRFRKPRS